MESNREICFTPQKFPRLRISPRQSQEHRTCRKLECPTWLTEAQPLAPLFSAFSGILAGSWEEVEQLILKLMLI